MEVKAKFDRITSQQGKTVMQFVLDDACSWALGELSQLANRGAQVMLGVTDPQQRIDIDAATGDAPDTEPLPFGGRFPEAVEVAAMAEALIAQAEADAADAQSDGEPYDGGDTAF